MYLNTSKLPCYTTRSLVRLLYWYVTENNQSCVPLCYLHITHNNYFYRGKWSIPFHFPWFYHDMILQWYVSCKNVRSLDISQGFIYFIDEIPFFILSEGYDGERLRSLFHTSHSRAPDKMAYTLLSFGVCCLGAL